MDARPNLPPIYGPPPTYPLAYPPSPYAPAAPASTGPFRDELTRGLARGTLRIGVLGVQIALVVGGALLLAKAWGRFTTWIRAKRVEDRRVDVRDVTPVGESGTREVPAVETEPTPAPRPPTSALPAPLTQVPFDYAELVPPDPPRWSAWRGRARS